MSRLSPPHPPRPQTTAAQILEWHHRANSVDKTRIWEFCEDCARNGIDPTHEEAMSFNARQIVLRAAYDLDMDDEARANPAEFGDYQ